MKGIGVINITLVDNFFENVQTTLFWLNASPCTKIGNHMLKVENNRFLGIDEGIVSTSPFDFGVREPDGTTGKWTFRFSGNLVENLTINNALIFLNMPKYSDDFEVSDNTFKNIRHITGWLFQFVSATSGIKMHNNEIIDCDIDGIFDMNSKYQDIQNLTLTNVTSKDKTIFPLIRIVNTESNIVKNITVRNSGIYNKELLNFDTVNNGNIEGIYIEDTYLGQNVLTVSNVMDLRI
jgi:hypothetical protein